jgi:hypothetical protein
MVPGDVKLEGGNAIFKPSNRLKPLTNHTVIITKDVKDITGNSLKFDKVWSFTTGSKHIVREDNKTVDHIKSFGFTPR